MTTLIFSLVCKDGLLMPFLDMKFVVSFGKVSAMWAMWAGDIIALCRGRGVHFDVLGECDPHQNADFSNGRVVF